jgi:hypothetical protein
MLRIARQAHDRRAALARAARQEVEVALEAVGWPWRASLSMWLDALLVIEEAEP